MDDPLVVILPVGIHLKGNRQDTVPPFLISRDQLDLQVFHLTSKRKLFLSLLSSLLAGK
jgi:hypothetical protein